MHLVMPRHIPTVSKIMPLPILIWYFLVDPRGASCIESGALPLREPKAFEGSGPVSETYTIHVALAPLLHLWQGLYAFLVNSEPLSLLIRESVHHDPPRTAVWITGPLPDIVELPLRLIILDYPRGVPLHEPCAALLREEFSVPRTVSEANAFQAGLAPPLHVHEAPNSSCSALIHLHPIALILGKPILHDPCEHLSMQARHPCDLCEGLLQHRYCHGVKH
mmetsp:Transcript_92006/g.204199  ORF Transcript_92006/g.204199 Transcript_92006/m.204199 type:complete len:221 (-) Transcript_92006:147-809(-)